MILPTNCTPQLHTSAPTATHIVVLSPWGDATGYSGPMVLASRLFQAVTEQEDVLFTCSVVTWSDAPASFFEWAHPQRVVKRPRRGGIWAQVVWGVKAGVLARKSSSRSIVHLHGAYFGNFLAAAIACRSDTAAVAFLPVVESGDLHRHKRFKALVIRTLQRRTAATTALAYALSGTIASELVALGLPSSRVFPINNAAATATLNTPSESGRADLPFTIIFVGKVGPIKRPEMILSAIAHLQERGHVLHAKFVGPIVEQHREALDKIIQRHHLQPFVTFTGQTSEVWNHMSTAHAFVLPSSSEGMPGALAEAMMAGLPCVVTDVGSMATHVLAAKCGYIAEPTPEGLANAILPILDEARRLQLSNNARSYAAAQFSNESVASTYSAALQKVTRHE